MVLLQRRPTALQWVNSAHSNWWTSLPTSSSASSPLLHPQWAGVVLVMLNVIPTLLCRSVKGQKSCSVLFVDHLHYTWLSSVWSGMQEICLHRNSSCDAMNAYLKRILMQGSIRNMTLTIMSGLRHTRSFSVTLKKVTIDEPSLADHFLNKLLR